MTKLLLQLAGLVAILGVACCGAGFIQGGTPTNLYFEKEGGQLTLNYGKPDIPSAIVEAGLGETAPAHTPGGDAVVTAPADSTADASTGAAPAAVADSAAAPTEDLSIVTPTATPTGLDLDVSGGSVTLQAGDSWQLAVRGTTNFTTAMDRGTWEIDCHRLSAGQEVTFVVTYPTGTQLRELELAIGAGELIADGLACQSADLSVGAGRMTLTGITVSGECDIEVGLGTLDLAGSLARGTDIECGMGIVRCTLARPAEYGYSVEEAMGTVKIDGQSYSGLGTEVVHAPRAAVQFDIECGVGTVEVQFA